MKLVTFTHKGGARRAGALADGGTVVDLQAAHEALWNRPAPEFQSVLALAGGGSSALDKAYETVKAAASRAAAAVLPQAALKLLAPIPEPPQMRDFLCFDQHIENAFKAARKLRAQAAPDPAAALREMEEKGILAVPQVCYERPIFYHPNRLNVIGTDEEVVWPSYSNVMDFECEFGCYIGEPGRDIAKEKAREHIFGYTIFDDFSARDEQTKEMPGQLGPAKGKDFDGGNAMGPCLVTADELTDPYRLAMVVRVNGEEWNRGSSSTMRWRFEDCIAHVSRSETLHTGEFFGSGTVGGGCGLEHLRFLKSGDVVELEVEGIGVLRNRVVRK
jgi:2-keto-4-pentenoate hydratase/2-oxohepta-3-ene-1,7-dioic acid hydratase in catechol pathway